MKYTHRFLPLCVAVLAAFTSMVSVSRAAEAAMSPTGLPPYASLSLADQKRMAWWLEARYGMFIHWGVASIKGVELSWARGGSKPLDISPHDPAGYVEDPVYDHLYESWNPTAFDAKQWVRIAKAAGMKYMVFTAKHHDGFCQWDTKFTDYKITNTPFKRDVVKEFTAACREAGMKVGLYYSPRDWHHPDYGLGDNKAYRDYMNGQLTELLSNYGKIDVIWFDSYGRGDLKTFWGLDETWQLIKKLQPQAVINNRLAILGAYNQQGDPYKADFDTPEQSIGKMQTTRPWESCMCFVGHQWGYKPNGEMYTLDKLIQAIVSCASGDGNLLMNVGPMPTGQIEPRQVDRLKEAGDWLAKYGDTIYGTRGGPYRNGKWGGTTCKGNKIYVHIFDWLEQDSLHLLPLPQTITASKVLTGGTVQVKQSDKGVELVVDKAARDPIDTIIELTLDQPVTALVSGNAIHSIFENGLLGTAISSSAVVKPSSLKVGTDPATIANLVAIPAKAGAGLFTDKEANPHVIVDLGGEHLVKGLRVDLATGDDFKRGNLAVAWSSDGTTWNEVWQNEGKNSPFELTLNTVVAGAPLPGVKARYLRVMLVTPQGVLQLKRVEVFGE